MPDFLVPRLKGWWCTIFVLLIYIQMSICQQAVLKEQSFLCRYCPRLGVKNTQEFLNAWVFYQWCTSTIIHLSQEMHKTRASQFLVAKHQMGTGSVSSRYSMPLLYQLLKVTSKDETNKSSQPDSVVLPKGFKFQSFCSRNNFAASVTAISTGTEQWEKCCDKLLQDLHMQII